MKSVFAEMYILSKHRFFWFESNQSPPFLFGHDGFDFYHHMHRHCGLAFIEYTRAKVEIPMEKLDWVVVANGSQARILERSKTETHLWKELACLVHPATRAKGNDPRGDTAGHTISGRRGLAPRQEAKDHHRQIFCRQIAEKIEEGTSSNRIKGIVIFASTSMLGELLNQLNEGTKKLIVNTHHKDLTSLSTVELMTLFQQEFDR